MLFGQRLLDLLLPQSCRICDRLLYPERAKQAERVKNSDTICSDCHDQIQWVKNPFCSICGTPFIALTALPHPCAPCLEKKPAFDWHRSAALYEKPVNWLVHRFKFQARFDLTSLFASWLIDQLKNQDFRPDYLIPVPLSSSRLRKRTFNQSLELAKAVSKKTGIPVLIHSLQKTKNTKPQTDLPREERVKNLRGAFVWKDSSVNLKDKKIVLLDDVFTTGSTIQACSAVLKSQKPATIGAMTLALNPLQKTRPSG